MKILIITAHPFLPQLKGGAQQSANALIKALVKRHHRAVILCGLMQGGPIGLIGRLKLKLKRVFSNSKVAKDTVCGYAAYRAWFPWEAVEEVVKKERPDVILVLAGQPVKMGLMAKQTGIPVIMMLQNVEFDDHGGEFSELGSVPCVANSSFTANRYKKEYGVNSLVIHPIIYPERYRIDTTREKVVFINPNPSKGLEVAIEVAKGNPDIPFLFIEAWRLTNDELGALEQRIANLKNVTFQRAVPDIREVYKYAKILLAPSKWEEAYGRVATEAQISGIPVVASNIGGLPEAVGDGGILLDPEGDIKDWIKAVRELWMDENLYCRMVKASRAHADRPEVDVESQISAWENFIKDVGTKSNV